MMKNQHHIVNGKKPKLISGVKNVVKDLRHF